MKRILYFLMMAMSLLMVSACAALDATKDEPLVIIKITTSLAGISPEAAETEITNLIEAALMALPSLKRTSSTSREGGSEIWVEMRAATPLDALRQVQHRIDQVAPRLPKNVTGPVVVESSDSRMF